ncbi:MULTISPECIES: BON domain-containing protein [unclassified Undibacterium]|uniref:BON domain-containing protein n=1 Tax=unclassified Undibacterium TaxID=2630295 RepID=UPI002AC91E50|nr:MULTISPECIES: BON domain-containing protein [unclassified Undibacterium]MEB0139061.1 BON domain-containing protein [Undibacterium sp. CCC2.1]MEB0172982.1 BON domain-containing protein [Undibacterium sp. CCC1.1]MEB0177304.1 BON domain-containing protein [Undibacterium sp. CCC3.4]MEB0215900.1 BON domain-containing protein [Undibacterium sp. 5I2]WPX42101.1 BON domain-containing protein [Undibacterium sp. CCC3.4]
MKKTQFTGTLIAALMLTSIGACSATPNSDGKVAAPVVGAADRSASPGPATPAPAMPGSESSGTAPMAGAADRSAMPAGESTGQYVDDTAITAGVKAAILNDATLKVTEIKVETMKGTVQLSGIVGSEENIITAVQLARRVKGVVAVNNTMRLK